MHRRTGASVLCDGVQAGVQAACTHLALGAACLLPRASADNNKRMAWGEGEEGCVGCSVTQYREAAGRRDCLESAPPTCVTRHSSTSSSAS